MHPYGRSLAEHAGFAHSKYFLGMKRLLVTFALPYQLAQMAELVDALDSKSGIRKDVQVRFLFWALNLLHKTPILTRYWGFVLNAFVF